MLKKNIDIYALPGWGFSSNIFSVLNNSAFNIIGLDYMEYPMHSLASLVEGFKNHIPDHAYLLGWSFGGLLAIAFAIHYPERIKKLILISSQAKLISDGDWIGINQSVADDFLELFMSNPTRQLEQFIRYVSYPSCSLAFKNKLKKYLLPKDHRVLTRLLKMLLASDLREDIKHLNAKILYIINDEDGVIPQTNAQLRQLTKSTEIVHFKHLGHAGFLEEHQSYIDIINGFVTDAVIHSS